MRFSPRSAHRSLACQLPNIVPVAVVVYWVRCCGCPQSCLKFCIASFCSLRGGWREALIHSRTNLCHACINIFIVTSRKMCAKSPPEEGETLFQLRAKDLLWWFISCPPLSSSLQLLSSLAARSLFIYSFSNLLMFVWPESVLADPSGPAAVVLISPGPHWVPALKRTEIPQLLIPGPI